MPRKRRHSTKCRGTVSGSSMANQGPSRAHISPTEQKPDTKVLEELLRRRAKGGDYSPSPSGEDDDSASGDDSNDGGSPQPAAGTSPPPLGGRIAFLESRMVEIDRCMRSIVPHLSAVNATLQRIAEIPTEARPKRDALCRRRNTEDDHFRGLARSQSLQEMVSSPTALQETSGIVRGCDSSYSFGTAQDAEFLTQARTSEYNTSGRNSVSLKQQHLIGGSGSQHNMLSMCYPQPDRSTGHSNEQQMQQQAMYVSPPSPSYGQHSSTNMLGFASREQLVSNSGAIRSGSNSAGVTFTYPSTTSGNPAYMQHASTASQTYFHGNAPNKTTSQLHCSYMPVGSTSMMPAVFSSSERVSDRGISGAVVSGGSLGAGGSGGASVQQLGTFPMTTGYYAAAGPVHASGSATAITWPPGMTLVPSPAVPHARKNGRGTGVLSSDGRHGAQSFSDAHEGGGHLPERGGRSSSGGGGSGGGSGGRRSCGHGDGRKFRSRLVECPGPYPRSRSCSLPLHRPSQDTLRIDSVDSWDGARAVRMQHPRGEWSGGGRHVDDGSSARPRGSRGRGRRRGHSVAPRVRLSVQRVVAPQKEKARAASAVDGAGRRGAARGRGRAGRRGRGRGVAGGRGGGASRSVGGSAGVVCGCGQSGRGGGVSLPSSGGGGDGSAASRGPATAATPTQHVGMQHSGRLPSGRRSVLQTPPANNIDSDGVRGDGNEFGRQSCLRRPRSPSGGTGSLSPVPSQRSRRTCSTAARGYGGICDGGGECVSGAPSHEAKLGNGARGSGRRGRSRWAARASVGAKRLPPAQRPLALAQPFGAGAPSSAAAASSVAAYDVAPAPAAAGESTPRPRSLPAQPAPSTSRARLPSRAAIREVLL